MIPSKSASTQLVDWLPVVWINEAGGGILHLLVFLDFGSDISTFQNKSKLYPCIQSPEQSTLTRSRYHARSKSEVGTNESMSIFSYPLKTSNWQKRVQIHRMEFYELFLPSQSWFELLDVREIYVKYTDVKRFMWSVLVSRGFMRCNYQCIGGNNIREVKVCFKMRVPILECYW